VSEPLDAVAVAYEAVRAAEPTEYVTDPVEVAALIAASPFAPRRRPWWRR